MQVQRSMVVAKASIKLRFIYVSVSLNMKDVVVMVDIGATNSICSDVIGEKTCI